MEHTRGSSRYMMAVLAYYRAEWTDVADDDEQFRIVLTEDLRSIIKGCRRGRANVPNAAKEVHFFLDMRSG